MLRIVVLEKKKRLKDSPTGFNRESDLIYQTLKWLYSLTYLSSKFEDSFSSVLILVYFPDIWSSGVNPKFYMIYLFLNKME